MQYIHIQNHACIRKEDPRSNIVYTSPASLSYTNGQKLIEPKNLISACPGRRALITLYAEIVFAAPYFTASGDALFCAGYI